jgi:hypothetical protein
MKIQPPEPVSVDKMTFDVSELEPLFQAPPMDLKPWPEAMITLQDGRVLYIREARPEDVPLMLGFMKRVMEVEKDFYDIVGVRVYAEILGWHRKRLKDPFHLIGLIDGVWAGLANGRVMNEDIALSLHTMAFARRGRIGWAMYYAKTYHALEILGCKEWWSTFESYNGWRMAGIEMAQPTKPWPEIQHELGGARVYYLTKKYWDSYIKAYASQMIGDTLHFDVPDEIKKRNEVFRVPEELAL